MKPKVGPKGGWIIDEEDRASFSAVIKLSDRVIAVDGSIEDCLQTIEKFKARIKILADMKNECERMRGELEFKVFPKYGMRLGQIFETENWELKGVGPAKEG